MLAGLALAGLGCHSAPRRLIHLVYLVQAEKTGRVSLPAGSATPESPYQTEPALNAARIVRLELRARGSATLATLAWKLSSDHNFPVFRTLSFPVAPDGAEHSYEIDMQRVPEWTGRVESLRLAVDQGELDVVKLTGQPSIESYRSMSLRGESLPALPGLARTEVKIADDLPSGSVLEARLGLVPEFDRPGTRAVFRAWQEETRGRRKLLLEETLEGTGMGGSGWHLVTKKLSGGGRFWLEVAASRGGQPLPEGAALWGDPLIVTPGTEAGRNLVVILVDTLRADVVGSYGSREGLTPNLDRFAAQGIRFDEMVSPAPWTLPSVASLMTGLQPQTHGAGMVYDMHRYAPTGLTRGVRTLALTLREAGFYTFGVYHNVYVNPAFGLQKGFDEYVSREEGAGALVDRALAGLERYSADRRFFLYLHIFDLHNPYRPPAEECRTVARPFAADYHGALGCSVDRGPESPNAIPPPADRRWYEGLYRAEVAYTDRQIGRFLAGLHDLGMDDDTVVAVLSDHGEEFWTRLDRERDWGYEPKGDHGHTMYQELLHVPAIVRIPGRKPAVVRGPVQPVDLFPTLLRLVSVEPPPSQGNDLAPLLDSAALPQRPLLIADVILHGRPRWAVRRGAWKLIVPRDPGPPLELYNLERDPAETRNLAAARPDVVASLRALGERELAQRRKDRARFIPSGDTVGATYLDWTHIAELRALGYLR